jgi:hypothetical protein
MFVEAVGLKEAKLYFDSLPDVARRAASLAINQTSERKAIPLARQAMATQVAFPVGYLNPPRFELRSRDSPSNLVASLAGRFTPTSLARFAVGDRRVGLRSGTGLTVIVHPGRPQTLPRAFLLNLRGGNLGLAIRLRVGETIRNRRINGKTFSTGALKGVTLLYGPSVDQVFRTVAGDITPEVLANLETEFLRQFVRLTDG